MSRQTLAQSLQLERLEVNLFRGTTPAESPRKRIYGGQVIAQALLAAYETVEGRACHSLHCYFIRPGDPNIPIILEVDRSRDGGSFTTRRVVAIQHGQQIFNFSASFQSEEVGRDHQVEMPDAPSAEAVGDDFAALREQVTPETVGVIGGAPPIEMRTVGGPMGLEAAATAGTSQQVWFRAREPLGADPRLHHVVMAYASDFSLLGTAVRAHGLNWRTPGLQAASLDHAMWFHRPTDFNEWHLYQQSSPSASGGRGFSLGQIYRASDGALVASTAQEGLMRVRPA
jgi:acyl-CoA thioesterase-2